ncbi:MAG: hypothetical protein HYX76_15790 [Acidobacteria bacterium]|nr:hypothetical protein [Acidobacteriota bacterium]
MTPLLVIRVECHAGHRGDETPRRFYVGERRVEVREVLDRWLAPDHRYFKVSGDNGDVYIIRHDGVADQWELTVFEARG